MRFSEVSQRLWKQLQEGGKTICRALGLNVIFSFFSFLRYQTVGRGYTEQTKIAIRKSRTTALLRALIHIIPVTVALWEVVLNWNTYFVGYNVYNLAYYQFGAKLHEMAIQASLSAVIFSYVRYELVLGDGIPFGALFSGLQISQASYFWSMEFWGTVCSQNIPAKSKLRLLSVVAASIFLAAVTGPSSAILLVPRSNYWPAGSTDIWINITSSSLWPARTNAYDVPSSCLNASTLDVNNSACPSHGWTAIQDYLYTTYHSLDKEYLSMTGMVHLPDWQEVTSLSSQRRLRFGAREDKAKDWGEIQFLATTQQAVVADALTETGNLWDWSMLNVSTGGHGSVLQRQSAIHAINGGYYQPYTSASCTSDVIRGPHDESAVVFQIPRGVDPNLSLLQSNDSNFVEYPGITKDQILDTPGSIEQSRLKWIQLPQESFNGTAIGAVILPPRSVADLTQDLLICTLAAGWGSSLINTSTYAGGETFTTSVIDPSAIAHDERYFNQSLLSQTKQTIAETLAGESTLQYLRPLYPEKPVIVSEAWAKYLNPLIPALNTTVIDILMSTNKPGGEKQPLNQRFTAMMALSGLLANGLATIGATATLQGDIKTIVKPDGSSEWDGDYWFSGKGDMFTVDPEESKDWVKFRVDSTIDGYAYNIRGAPPKVAIVFLLAYCIIVLSHVVYAGISGISSTCWDSIGEVTALAMNSTPTTLLRNTCAGIMELNIFKLPVRVLAVRDDEGDGEHLELVFGDVDEKFARGTPIKPNRVYGTLPKMAKGEKSE